MATIDQIILGAPSSASVEQPEVIIHKFSDLDERTQQVAFKAIASINEKTSTAPGTTWENYTQIIKERTERCLNAKHTLFVAQVADRFVGYAAFYKKEDDLYVTRGLNTNQAYCSWVAVDEEYRGKGIALKLESRIFELGTGVTTFFADVKRGNEASIAVFEKFRTLGCEVSREQFEYQYCYTISKT